MKNVLIVFVLLVFALGNSLALAASKKEIISDIDKIEKETQACYLKAGNLYYKALCNYEAMDKYEIEIDKIILKFKKAYTKKQYEKLSENQEAWKNYFKQNVELLEKTLELSPPFYPYWVCSVIKLNNFKQRLSELENMYKLYLNLKEENLFKILR